MFSLLCGRLCELLADLCEGVGIAGGTSHTVSPLVASVCYKAAQVHPCFAYTATKNPNVPWIIHHVAWVVIGVPRGCLPHTYDAIPFGCICLLWFLVDLLGTRLCTVLLRVQIQLSVPHSRALPLPPHISGTVLTRCHGQPY